MPWNPDFPLGTVSVKDNRAIGDANTKYIQTTMGNAIVGTNLATTTDHFWNVSGNLNGHHRFIKSPAFTVGSAGNPGDPDFTTGIDGVLYLKTTNGRAEWFHKNTFGTYQAVPSFKSGTVAISGSTNWKDLKDIPANCYGDIFMYMKNFKSYCQTGSFSSDGTSVRSFSNRIKVDNTSADYFIELRNEPGGSLMIQARRGHDFNSTYDGDWNYIITYRAQ